MAKNYRISIFGTLLGMIALILVCMILIPIPTDIPQKSRIVQSDSTKSDAPILASFIGDSTCAGAGDNLTEANRWPYLISQKLKWYPIIACIGGSGYLSAGPDGKSTYMQKFDELLLKLKKPNIIIVEGGQNDIGKSPGEISEAACSLYSKIRKNFPKVDLIVMTPFYGLSEAPPVVSEVEDVVMECARKHQARLITGVRKWLQDRPELLVADKIHPNRNGHTLIAKNFISWFRANQ
jgi:lysophospholipase L1-like esterase